MENQPTCEPGSVKESRLQISCSTPELHRRSGQNASFLDNRATPPPHPEPSAAGASTATDAARKGPRRGGLHQRLISRYVASRPGTRTAGFPDAVRRILATFTVDGAECNTGEFAELLERAFPLRFLPDAFRVDEETRTLTLVEVEVSNRISPAKWLAIADLHWLLDEEPWAVELHVVARTGDVFEVDLPLVAVSLLGTDAQVAEELASLDDCPPGHSSGAC